MAPLKILILASSPGLGLTYHLTRLSVSLEKRGHDVTVLSGPKEQVTGLSAELWEAGIERFVSNHLDKKAIYSIYKSKKDIQRILETRDIDVIHAQGITHTLEGYLAIRWLHSDKKPAIATSIHSIPGNMLLQKPKWAMITAILNKCSDVVLPVSNDTRAQLIRHGVDPKKTMTVYNAIDLDVFDNIVRRARTNFEGDRKDKPTVVCVANLIPRKGLAYYLMAAAEVLKRHPARFYVIGDGPLRKNLGKLAYSLVIEEEVVFTGRIPWPEMYHILSNIADVCVSSSIGELFPFYILECMAAKKPIVATDVGGVREAVVDGENGYLIPPKDSASLAEAILRLINRPDKARKMSVKGRRMIEQKFSMDVVAQKLRSIYEAANAKKNSGG